MLLLLFSKILTSQKYKESSEYLKSASSLLNHSLAFKKSFAQYIDCTQDCIAPTEMYKSCVQT